jgi:hypothetical protein
MMKTVSNIRFATILIALLTAAAAWYGVTAYPLAANSEDIVGLEGAPGAIVVLGPGDTVRQEFRTPRSLISALTLYATDEKLTGQKLSLKVSDVHGRLLARSKSVRPSYRGDKLRLTFPLNNWIEADTIATLILELTHTRGDPLRLFALTENTHRAGTLSFNTAPQSDLDLALSTTWPMFASPGIKRGILAGMVTLAGALLISLLPARPARIRWVSAGILLIIVTPLALGGFWANREMLGISDWDHNFAQHEILRNSLLVQHTFPFWNPYTCGGTAGLADPEFPLFTPTFLLELAFGVPTGLRLAIFLSTAVGSVGMLALSRRIGLSVHAALLSTLAAFFSSVNLLEIVEGHPNIFAAMWVPWIFWAWLGAYRENSKLEAPNPKQIQNLNVQISKRFGSFVFRVLRLFQISNLKSQISSHSHWALLCGVFLALTFYQGGVYLLFYTVIAFLVLVLAVPHHRAAFIVTLSAGLWAVTLAAIKLIPSIFWLSQFQDTTYAASTTTLPYLYEILLGRHLHGAEILPRQGTGWHEYGAYLGPIIIALSFLGLTQIRRPVVRALAIAATLALLLSSAGPLLEPLFDMLPFIPRSTISRVVLFAVIPLALLSGLGLDQLRRWSKRAHAVVPALIGLVAMTLMSLTYQLSEQAFIIPAGDVNIAPAPAPIAFTSNVHEKRIEGVDYTRSYLATLAGFGTLDYCTPLSPTPSVVTVEQGEDSSPVSLSDYHRGSVELTYWSPNQIRVSAVINQQTDVIINTNYAKGWTVNDEPVLNIAGRVATVLGPGNYDLIFQYHPPGFLAGLLITLAAITAAPLVFCQSAQPPSKYQRQTHAEPPLIPPKNRPT